MASTLWLGYFIFIRNNLTLTVNMPFSTNLSRAIEVCVTLYMYLKQARDFLSVIKKNKINIFNSEMLGFPD